MSRIDSIFSDLRANKRRALMPFITAGYPSQDVTREVIPALEKAGASVLEIGFPFSDPIADGPVIASSMHLALELGITPGDVFKLIKSVRPSTNAGLIAMVSDSIVSRFGPEEFVIAAKQSGFDGLIVPDIDVEAAKPLSGLAHLHELSFTLLIAPTTKPERIKRITDLCNGFLYLLARVGITGERDETHFHGLEERVKLIRKYSELPIAVGFGISKPEHVAEATRHADAAIVGSALVRRMGDTNDPVKSATLFIEELATALYQTD